MLSKAYGKETMKKSSVFEWHKQFREGHMSKSQMKAMPITFFNVKGICSLSIHSTRPNSQPGLLYGNTEVVTYPVHRKRPKLWPNDWILHHINTTAHKALSVKQSVAQKSIIEMEHPPYSPDFDLNNF
jgi:hypothetical protein